MGGRIKVSVREPLSTKKNSAPHKQKTGFRSQSSPVDRILFLQRTVGNQAVQRLIRSGTLQAKLRIGQPGDVYEQEADRVADEVMRMSEPQAVSSDKLSIQGTCPICEEDELRRQPVEEKELQRQPIEEKKASLYQNTTAPFLNRVSTKTSVRCIWVNRAVEAAVNEQAITNAP